MTATIRIWRCLAVARQLRESSATAGQTINDQNEQQLCTNIT